MDPKGHLDFGIDNQRYVSESVVSTILGYIVLYCNRFIILCTEMIHLKKDTHTNNLTV